MADLLLGLVVRHGANRYLVEESAAAAAPRQARQWACVLRGRLRQGRREGVRLAVIGDQVRFSVVADATERRGVIEEILPRRNQISRPAPSGRSARRLEQIIIANLDRLWVIASLASPPLNRRFIDRILASAEFQGVHTGVVLNKVDLADAESPAPLVELYERLGYPVRVCSAVDGTGLDRLAHDLSGGISALVGLSGVGKSSLLAAIQPGLELRIAAVGERSGHGRHTTSVSNLYRIDGGGWVADTPGMREFGLWGMLKSDLGRSFVEIDSVGSRCHFRDCLHVEEPDCEVQQAVAEGQIDEKRYESYRALLEELPSDDLERRLGR